MESIEFNWGLIGAKLAKLSDKEQAEFFKGFAFEINTFESEYKGQLQMCHVGSQLTKKEKEILENALPSIWYKEE